MARRRATWVGLRVAAHILGRAPGTVKRLAVEERKFRWRRDARGWYEIALEDVYEFADARRRDGRKRS